MPRHTFSGAIGPKFSMACHQWGFPVRVQEMYYFFPSQNSELHVCKHQTQYVALSCLSSTWEQYVLRSLQGNNPLLNSLNLMLKYQISMCDIWTVNELISEHKSFSEGAVFWEEVQEKVVLWLWGGSLKLCRRQEHFLQRLLPLPQCHSLLKAFADTERPSLYICLEHEISHQQVLECNRKHRHNPPWPGLGAQLQRWSASVCYCVAVKKCLRLDNL